MLQQENPDDYVIATGETHSIKDFLSCAFSEVGISNWEKHVKQDPRFMRPAEVDVLKGNSAKAKDKLGWQPKVNFENLVKKMVKNDIAILSNK